MKTLLTIILSTFILTGGSMSAKATETAAYQTVKSVPEQKIEIRKYDPVMLVETPMAGDERNGAFRRLFAYISGENVKQSDIEMTAPVLMDDEKPESQKIPMTTPVFMDDAPKDAEEEGTQAMMSFVLPSQYTMDTAPIPTDTNVKLRELKDYNVAAIRFNGTLGDTNVQKHKDILVKWLNDNNYKVTGEYKKAGYNAPFTLPWMRRNEVLIPIDLR